MRQSRTAAWAALAAALLVAAGALLPLPPQFLSSQLDAGFGATLHFAAAHGHAVGSRLISTFGPLGFVFYDLYFPDTFVRLLLLRAGLAAATCWALAWIGLAAWGSPWGAAAALLVCAPFLASPDVWLLTLPVLALLLELPERPPPPALRLALGAAIGLAALTKFTVALAAAAVLLPLAVAALLARRAPLLPLAAGAAAVAGWLGSGHGAAAAVAYLGWSLGDLSAGYATAMQMPGPPGLTAHAIAVSVLVLAAGAALLFRRRGARAAPAMLGLAAVLFLLFKAGFVRADVHVYVTCFGLLVIAALLALSSDRRPARVAAAAAVAAVAAGSLWAHIHVALGPPLGYFGPLAPAAALGRLTALPFALGGDALARAHARRAAEVRAENPLPALPGAVDIYPTEQGLLLAHAGLAFRPRPVFQSYMAYSPRLAHANADFLRGGAAPDWILFRILPIDDRLPALDDAPSWPLLLSRYRFAAAAGTLAVLERRAQPRPWRLEPIERHQFRTGQAAPVPSASGLVWARIDVPETAADRLLAAAVRGPLVTIELALADGTRRDYRLVPALARDGFLLSPLVDTTAEFVAVLSGEALPDRAVRAFTVRIEATWGSTGPGRVGTVRFSRLVVEPPVPLP